MIKATFYYQNGSKRVIENNSAGKVIKSTDFNADGIKTEETDYNPSTGIRIRETFFHTNGISSKVIEYDPETGEKVKETNYDTEGNVI